MERDTRGMLGGGPASQNPRLTPKQIRRLLTSHCHLDVIALSTDVCVFDALSEEMHSRKRFAGANQATRGADSGGVRDMANAVLAQPPIPFSSIQNHDALSARRLRLH
jgi:hypothetical protein